MPYVGKSPANIIATAVDTTTGTFSGDLTVDTSTLVVDSANNRVGIGETDPDSTLTVKGASHTNLQVKSNSESTKAFIQTVQDSDIRIGSSTNHPVSFYQNSNERMRIDSSGNLLVGSTTSPSTARLEVRKDTNASDTLQVSAQLSTAGQYHDLALGISNAYAVGMRRHITTSTPSFLNPRLDFFVQNNNTYLPADRDVKMTILNNGNVGIGTSSPATRLHVLGNSRFGNSNAITANANADSVVIENTGSVGISILSGASSTGNIFFGDSGDNNIGEIQYNHSTNSLAFNVNASERMRISSAGNVGINDSGPEAKLHISENASGATYPILLQNRTNSNSSVGIRFIATGSDLGDGQFASIEAIGDTASNTRHHLAFKTVTSGGTPAERIRITEAGTLLWASTVDPSSSNSGISFNNATHPAINISGGSDTNFRHRIVFHNGNGVVGIISTSGSSTAYATSSDYRLKENVVEMTDATTRLKQLQPKRFNFIADADTTVDGFLAHEVQSVVPEAITGTHNEVDADGNPVYQGIDQAKLVPLLVKTIQELEARIVALENA